MKSPAYKRYSVLVSSTVSFTVYFMIWMMFAVVGIPIRLYLSGFEEMGSDPAEAESWLLAAAGKGDPKAKKLLKEAQKAKKDEVEYRRWVNTHRALWMGYWWNAYHYYTYWQAGYWYYY